MGRHDLFLKTEQLQKLIEKLYYSVGKSIERHIDWDTSASIARNE